MPQVFLWEERNSKASVKALPSCTKTSGRLGCFITQVGGQLGLLKAMSAQGQHISEQLPL